jgi:rare lipoprotein A (peptidoglycan hydrolase)
LNKVTDIRRISKEVVDTSTQVVKALPMAVITAEERLRRRLQAALRVALATTFLWLTAIVSIGATAAQAVAKTVGKDKAPRERRINARRHNHKNFKARSTPAMEGMASWYGHGFHKRKTASGRPFDKNALMAAHRTLPFGTMVRVINTENDSSVIVEITDRGPYVGNRVIDVSEAAATKLGFNRRGTAHVRLEVINNIFADANDYGRFNRPLSDVLRTPTYAIGTPASGR